MATQTERIARLGGEAVRIAQRCTDPTTAGFSYWSGYLEGLAFALVSTRRHDAIITAEEVGWMNNYVRTIPDHGNFTLTERQTQQLLTDWRAWRKEQSKVKVEAGR